VAFTLAFRVPSWATAATVGGSPLPEGSNGTLHRVAIAPGSSTVEVVLPMGIRIQRRYNHAAAVFRGPLLYSLDLPATVTTMPYCKPLHTVTDGSSEFCSNATYQVDQLGYQYRNRTAWNYALDVTSLTFEQVRSPDSVVPFSSSKPPVTIKATARQIQWGTTRGSAAAPPPSPVTSEAAAELVRLIPYGSTHGLSLVELPTLKVSRD
jgi:hypothetical protein